MRDIPTVEEAKSETIGILLVEDDDAVALLLQKMLSSWRYGAFNIRRAASLAAALREVAQGVTDVLLLDLGLPDSRGLDTFVRMSAAAARTPIIVLSGLDDEELAITAVRLGAQDYIVKGHVDVASLARAIRYAIERCRAQQELTKKHDLLRTVIESIPDQICLKDLESRFISVNPVTAQFFGAASPDEIIGKSDFDFFSREMATQFLAEEQALLQRALPCVNREAAITDCAGNTRWVLTTKVPMRDHAGNITGLLVINRDITERKHSEEALKQAHEELISTQIQFLETAKNKSVAQLAAGIAHEIKNPLAIALMGLEYLSSTVATSDDQVAKTLKDIREAILQADDIVRELLSFAVPSKLDLKTQDMNAITAHVLYLVQYEARKRDITLRLDLETDLPQLKLDRTKIEQALVNLLMNAIEATPNGGTVLITTRAKQLHTEGTEVIVNVEDTGSGIVDDNLAKLFEPFFTTKDVGEGTGLGLPVAKRIIELHGGTIHIGNRPEGGAKVTITLRTKEDKL